MVALSHHPNPGDALSRLASELESLEFGPAGAILSADRDRLAGMIRSYLIPRVIGRSTPPTVVVAGPTGSGKSTIVNSVAGVDVSATGALRPTTNVPVVLSSALWSADYETIGGVPCRIATDPSPILDSMVLVDSPDIDSTSTGHRAMAETLIDNADLVVFVTSALRYADDLPWQVLRRAVSRGAPVIHVLNRVGSASSGAIVDFKARLSGAGFGDDLVIVPEHHLSDIAQRVPSLAIRSLRQHLTSLLSNRSQFSAEVLDRVLRSTISQVTELVRSLDGTTGDLEGLRSRLNDGLAERISQVSTDGVADGLYPPPPAQPSRWEVRRWRRAARLDPAGVEAAEKRVAERIAAVIESDLRDWLLALHDDLERVDIDMGLITSELAVSSRSVAWKWIEYVDRIVSEAGIRNEWLAEAVLVDAATSSSSEAADILFGEDSGVVVGRARRELINRLEGVYELAGTSVIGSVARQHGDLDATGLKSSLDEVTALYAPVNA